MGLAIVLVVALILLAAVAVMLWGASEAMVRASRFLWRLLVERRR